MGNPKQQNYTVKVKSPVKIDLVHWSNTYGGDWELDQSTGESVVEAVMPGSSGEDAYQSTIGNLEGTFPGTQKHMGVDRQTDQTDNFKEVR